jgi:membrane fusion protein (multidrug efflux system)
VRLTRKQLILLCLACAFALGGSAYGYYWWAVDRFFQSTDDAYVGGDVTPISPHIVGFVADVAVKDNELVHAGQLLVGLDDRDVRAAADHADAVLEQRTATLGSLRAKYELQQSAIRQASADLDAKAAQADFAKVDAERYHTLALSNYGSRQDAERTSALDAQARASVASAQAALAAAKQQLTVLNADISEAAAAVAQARADLETARLNLGYAEIRAPIDGYVGNRAARVGAYVSQGTYLLTIVPAHGLWVDANFKEDQLARMKAGQPASVVADTLPGHVFHGHLLSLAPATGAVFSVIPPENATGNFTKIVQRVAVRIALDDNDPDSAMIRPGLSIIATIDTRAPPRSRAMNESASDNWIRGIVPFVVMCFGGFMALLDIQIVASSLQNIGGGLSAAQDEISWVQTAYLIAEIIVIPLSGWLTRVFSTRWLFTASAAGFTATSILCGLAWDIHSMILFRALQGALGASMIPIVFTTSLHYFQAPRRVYSAAVVGTIASVAPTLGPIIGGWITDTLN